MIRRNTAQQVFVNPHKHPNWTIGLLSACKRNHCWANGTAHIKASVLEGKWDRFWCIYLSAYQTLTRISFSQISTISEKVKSNSFQCASVFVFLSFTSETDLQGEEFTASSDFNLSQVTQVHLQQAPTCLRQNINTYIHTLSKHCTYRCLQLYKQTENIYKKRQIFRDPERPLIVHWRQKKWE